MPEITEEQKTVIRELRRGLGGRCGGACPADILVRKNGRKNGRFVKVWDCMDCNEYFLWISKEEIGKYCPCHCIPFETIDLRFSELLEEEV